MAKILIRRRQAGAARSVDVMFPAADRRQTDEGLHAILQGMQLERGRGTWSDADPEILIDGAFAGRLRRREVIGELVERILETAHAWRARIGPGGN